MNEIDVLHVEQLIMSIEEFLEPLHPIRHSNSFNHIKSILES